MKIPRGTFKDWCITVFSSYDAENFAVWCTAQHAAGFLQIAVIGDEIAASAIEAVADSGGEPEHHGQAFIRVNGAKNRGIAFTKLKSLLLAAGVGTNNRRHNWHCHMEPRKARDLDRAVGYCLKEHYPNIAKDYMDSNGLPCVIREGSKELLCLGWDPVANNATAGTKQGKRTDVDRFNDAVTSGDLLSFNEALLRFPGLCSRCMNYCKAFINAYAQRPSFLAEEWVDWHGKFGIQRWEAWLVHQLIEPEAENAYRKVNLVIDSRGNIGKSRFCHWFPRVCEASGLLVQVMQPGKLADMAYALCVDADIVLIDVDRSSQISDSHSLDYMFRFIEQIKTGVVFSPKYESGVKELANAPVQVGILCNKHPDPNRAELYRDRFNRAQGSIEAHLLNYQETVRDAEGNPIKLRLSRDRYLGSEYFVDSPSDIEILEEYALPEKIRYEPGEQNDAGGDGEASPQAGDGSDNSSAVAE